MVAGTEVVGGCHPRKGDQMETVLRPYAVAQSEGDVLWFLGIPTWIKATGEQTGGALGLIEQVIPAGDASPWHVHHAEDEAFYVVEGEMTFICGDERISAGPGTWVWGPRDVPHGFRVDGTASARVLLFAFPAGFEQFVVQMGEPATSEGSPPAEPPDMEKLMTLATKYRMEILGPLPD